MSTFSEAQIAATIDFHGHTCPGLNIGIRVAELVKSKFVNIDGSDLIAITETNMCAVDAIQFLTGCTFGKGNLIYYDWGKIAFTFFNKNNGEGWRATMRPSVRHAMEKEMAQLRSLNNHSQVNEIRQKQKDYLMLIELNELFVVTPPQISPPNPARVLASLECYKCGEMVMETKMRLLESKNYCIPCFE